MSVVVTAWIVNFWLPPLHMIYAPDHHFMRWIDAAARRRGLTLRWTPNDPDVVFASVFGDPKEPFDAFPNARVRVFFTGENQAARYLEHNSVAPAYDFAFGSVDTLPSAPARRLHVPLWMFTFDMLDPDSEDLRHVARNAPPRADRGGACMVAGSDFFGHRRSLLDAFSAAGVRVDCPGVVGRNVAPIDASLGRWEGKRRFLRGYAVCLCPENSLGPGYVTEKLLEACWDGAVPVYWGEMSDLDRAVVNEHRVLRFANDDARDVRRVASEVGALLAEPERLGEQASMPVFAHGAVDAIAAARVEVLAFLGQAFDAAVSLSASRRQARSRRPGGSAWTAGA